MRRLTPQQVRDLAEYDRDMEALKRDRERWAREKGKPGGSASPPARFDPQRVPGPTRTRFLVTTVRRGVGYADGRPHLVCRICLEPAHLVARTGLCQACAAEVAWGVKLARQGLKVVS